VKGELDAGVEEVVSGVHSSAIAAAVAMETETAAIIVESVSQI